MQCDSVIFRLNYKNCVFIFIDKNCGKISENYKMSVTSLHIGGPDCLLQEEETFIEINDNHGAKKHWI